MKKIRILLLVPMLFLPFLFLYAGGAGEKGQAAGPAVSKGPARLSIAMAESLRIEDFETNLQTRLLEKAANVDLDFVLFPSTDYINKLNLMVMAGGQELPDTIVASPGDSMVYQWAQEGAIIPVTGYYKDPKLTPNLQDAIKRTGVDFTPMIVAPDGEIYGLPNYNQNFSTEYQFRFWYYAPWFEKLGLKTPETTEEFRNFLRAVKTGDPNGNGKPDEIPFTGTFDLTKNPLYGGWFHFLMNSFVYTNTQFVTISNGTLSVPYITSEWKDGLKYIRSLFAEELLPQEIFTQDPTAVNTLLNNETIQIFTFVANSASAINAKNPARYQYRSSLPVKGPKGLRGAAYFPATANIAYMISANCKDPEAAFRLGDAMLDREICIISRHGERGVNWDYIKDVKNPEQYSARIPGWPISIVKYKPDWWSGSTVYNSGWRQAGAAVLDFGVINGWGMTAEDLATEGVDTESVVIYQNGGFKPKEFIPKFIYSQDENREIREISANLLLYLTEMTGSFLTGRRDIDSSWNAYLAELDKIGLKRFIQINQEVYNRFK